MSRAEGHPVLSASDPSELVHPKRRLIVCCDGTWKTSDVKGRSLSNVAKLTRCISDVDNWKGHQQDPNNRHFISQIVHYQPGVGMGTGTGANTYDAFTGRGISKSIKQAYGFLCLNWSSSEDEIVLIGYSRGAFAVRCIAQFMNDVGLLTKSGLRHLPKLFKAWKRTDTNKISPKADNLRAQCDMLEEWGEIRPGSRKAKIEACGVWDTVSAVGPPQLSFIYRPSRKKFLSVGKIVTPNIKFAVQALALDETRRNFRPEVWTSHDKDTQSLTQRWFAGNHADVGGDEDTSLSNITLAWMIGQLTDVIQFDVENLWAITTTRDWSRPSPGKDPDEDKRMRSCRVFAKAPLGPKILQSEDSLPSRISSFIQRTVGGFLKRNPTQGLPHYSVAIFDHLGIGKYKARFPNPDASFELNQVIPPLVTSNAFEGEILERWTKHILCAHINILQARNGTEAKLPQLKDIFRGRLEEELKEPASYESLIPICAILSAFHVLAKHQASRIEAQAEAQAKQSEKQIDPSESVEQQINSKEMTEAAEDVERRESTHQHEQTNIRKEPNGSLETSISITKDPFAPQQEPILPTPLDFSTLCKQPANPLPDEKSWFFNLGTKTPAPFFSFLATNDAVAPLEMGQELVLEGSLKNPKLVFARDFRVLMGRVHDVTNVVDNVNPCQKCRIIWPVNAAA